MYFIVGSGISGLVCANLLNNKNIKTQVLEAKNRIGGLIHCEVVEGFLYHRVGGHVFNSKNKDVLDWFWGKFNRNAEFTKVERNAKIYLNNKYLGYPIENSLHQLDKSVAEKVIDELLSNKNLKTSNFHDFLLHKFG